MVTTVLFITLLTLPTCGTVKRRNKWICALKTILAELKIYGPSGGPKPPDVNRYTKVPYDEVKQQDQEAKAKKEGEGPEQSRKLKAGEEWNLGDKNAVLSAFF